MGDIWNERNFRRRKWTNGWTESCKNPMPDSEDPMKQARIEYERHTLICSVCSMFGLKSIAQSRRSSFCADGFRLLKRYRKIRFVWKHQHPDAYARSVVGGVLHGITEIKKKKRRKEQDEAYGELNYNKK